MSATDHICESEKIAAFIDGDLEPAARAAFEAHVKQCSHCNSELQAQRQFMCELDSALASPFDLPVPLHFAEVVAVRAQSDMRGVRDRSEHAKALRLCLMLGLAAFALLGVTTTQAVISSAESIANKAFGVLGLFGKTIYDAAVGLSVISRVLSGGLTANSRLAGLTALLVAVAIGLLSILISRYHRASLAE